MKHDNAILNKPDDTTMLEIKQRKFLVGGFKLSHTNVIRIISNTLSLKFSLVETDFLTLPLAKLLSTVL